MRRRRMTAAVCFTLAAVLALPAAAKVDAGPNAQQLVGVQCPDEGLTFEVIWVASASSVAGHDLEGNTVGVAKSLFATDGVGTPLAELFHRPGRGLDDITVWCFWADTNSPTGFVGGDVLFNAHLRP